MGRGIGEGFCQADGRTEGGGQESAADWDLCGASVCCLGDFRGVGGGDEGGGEISGEEVVWNGWGEGAGGDGADDG